MDFAGGIIDSTFFENDCVVLIADPLAVSPSESVSIFQIQIILYVFFRYRQFSRLVSFETWDLPGHL